MTTRNLAILCSDVVGSTATTASLDRAAFQAFRDDYERIIKTTIEASSGRVFKSMGDGYLAAFEAATDAVLCGVRVVDQIESMQSTGQWDERFETRIGISSGDVTVDDVGDCFGVPVIAATRAQSMAKPNQVWFTESVFYAMNRLEIGYEDLGAISLKGLDDAARLFRALPRGSKTDATEFAVMMTDTRSLDAFTMLADRGDAKLERKFETYDQIVFDHALKHGGMLRYNYADQYLFTFSDPVAACRTALAIVHDERGKDHVSMCAALSFGKLRKVRGRYLGSAVSRTTPILLERAVNDEILASQELVERVGVGARFEAVGSLRVKGLVNELQYHRLVEGE